MVEKMLLKFTNFVCIFLFYHMRNSTKLQHYNSTLLFDMIFYCTMQIYPIGGKLWLTRCEEVKEEAKKELMDCFKVLEGELGDKPYYGGDIFGYVDVALIPFYCLFYTFEILGNFSMEAEYPKLVAWAKRCIMQKKSVSNTLCDQYKLYQAVLEIKKKLGTWVIKENIIVKFNTETTKCVCSL